MVELNSFLVHVFNMAAIALVLLNFNSLVDCAIYSAQKLSEMYFRLKVELRKLGVLFWRTLKPLRLHRLKEFLKHLGIMFWVNLVLCVGLLAESFVSGFWFGEEILSNLVERIKKPIRTFIRRKIWDFVCFLGRKAYNGFQYLKIALFVTMWGTGFYAERKWWYMICQFLLEQTLEFLKWVWANSIEILLSGFLG